VGRIGALIFDKLNTGQDRHIFQRIEKILHIPSVLHCSMGFFEGFGRPGEASASLPAAVAVRERFYGGPPRKGRIKAGIADENDDRHLLFHPVPSALSVVVS
jgi:hypothetical protein